MTDQKNPPVGYKNPPQHTRFRKGGPQPARRRQANAAVDVHKILTEPVRVGEGRRAKKVHPYELALMQMAQKAIKGDFRSMEFLIDLFVKYGVIGSELLEPVWPGRLSIPDDYDRAEWLENLSRFGPPPWPLEHDGLCRPQELRDAVRR